MGTPVYAIVLAAIVVLSVLLWELFLSHKARLRWKLRFAGGVRIAKAQPGEVSKLVGRVRRFETEPLVAPLSARECVYFEVAVAQHIHVHKGSVWKDIVHEAVRQDFWIEDRTGRALVCMDDPEVLLDIDKHVKVGNFGDPPAEMAAFLMERGLAIAGDARYREGAIEEGELVAVLGECRRVAGHTPGADADEWVVEVRAGPDSKLVVTDKPSLV